MRINSERFNLGNDGAAGVALPGERRRAGFRLSSDTADRWGLLRPAGVRARGQSEWHSGARRRTSHGSSRRRLLLGTGNAGEQQRRRCEREWEFQTRRKSAPRSLAPLPSPLSSLQPSHSHSVSFTVCDGPLLAHLIFFLHFCSSTRSILLFFFFFSFLRRCAISPFSSPLELSSPFFPLFPLLPRCSMLPLVHPFRLMQCERSSALNKKNISSRKTSHFLFNSFAPESEFIRSAGAQRKKRAPASARNRPWLAFNNECVEKNYLCIR